MSSHSRKEATIEFHFKQYLEEQSAAGLKAEFFLHFQNGRTDQSRSQSYRTQARRSSRSAFLGAVSRPSLA